MNAKFHIPDFFKHTDINLTLIDKIKEHPEFFYDGVEIASCFGCFPPGLWNGGRALGGNVSYDFIQAVIKAFNERNVPIRYTFTNPTLTEKDLKDPFCNRITKLAENGLNEIIVNVPFLEKYIREKYPKYPLISSTVKQIEDYDALMREFEKGYKLVVLDYNWNNDFEKLDKIPRELRERCEILVCPYCTPHCKRRGEHYVALGEAQRESCRQAASTARFSNDAMQKAIDFSCPNTGYNFYQIQDYCTFVKREDIYTKYMDMGFCNFKIEGRVLHSANVVESYVYYMVKPEHRDRVRLELLMPTPKLDLPKSASRRMLPRM